MKSYAYLAVCSGRWFVTFHRFNFSDTKCNIVHTAQRTLIYTPSSKPTCHENYNAKNNYTSLSQIIFSCAVKLKYDRHSYIYHFMNLPSFFSPSFTALTL